MNYEASTFYSKRLNEEFSQELGGNVQSSSIFDEFSSLYLQLVSVNATTKQKILGQNYVNHVVCAIKGLV